MKIKLLLIVSLVACILIGSRLYQVSNPIITPLPLYEISEPDAANPNHVNRFFGRWEGVWGGTFGRVIGKSVDTTLVFHGIKFNRLKVILSYGGNRELGVAQGFNYFSVPVTNPEKPRLEWDWGEQGITFRFDLVNDKTINGEAVIKRSGEKFKITLTKTTPYPKEFLLRPKNSAPYVYKMPASRGDGWDVASLIDSKFDENNMIKLVQSIKSRKLKNVHSLLVVHAGKLVLEEYFDGEDAQLGVGQLGHVSFDHESLHDIRSATKSVTSVLLGIAFKNELNLLSDIPVSELLDNLSKADKKKLKNINLEHILTMTAGFKWNEMQGSLKRSKSDFWNMYKFGDPVKYVLSKPKGSKPGEIWLYNSGLTEMLREIVEAKTGKEFQEYATDVLFKPLGIKNYAWNTHLFSSEITTSAAGGLRLNARDFAKIGLLYLNKGRWQNRQIVPADWVTKSTHRHIANNGIWSEGGIWGYGYQWWHGNLNSPKPTGVIAAVGYGGQRLFIVPSEDLVVILFSGNHYSGSGDETEILRRIIGSKNPTQN